MILSLDTETTGLDLRHGAKPFFITTCNSNGKQPFIEWDVDPLTREPIIPQEDLSSLQEMINSADRLIFHNAKFDTHAIDTILPDMYWDWSKIEDTLVAAHVLASNEPKDLTTLGIKYLKRDIESYELKMEKIVKEVINLTRKLHPSWRLAKKGLPEMPSAKQKTWKFDTWLPRAYALRHKYPLSHTYFDITRKYANADSDVTYHLWMGIGKWIGMKRLLEERDLWEHYRFRMESVRIAYEMECRGIAFSQERTNTIAPKYLSESKRLRRELVSIAKEYDYELKMPKKGYNDSLREFMNDYLKLEPYYNKKGKRTYDKREALPYYIDTLPSGSKQLDFVKLLLEKSNYDTSLTYIQDYQRYGFCDDVGLWWRLYPNLNPVGSKTIRWTSSNPNSQNIAKPDEDRADVGLRYMFGPAEDREWWSFDAKNVELRIPFYVSGEPDMIALFEKPNEPPFYGSNHMLVFSVLWEDLWHDAIKQSGIDGAHDYCKKRYKKTNYQWTKNFDFALQYGSGAANANRTAHHPTAYQLIAERFSKLNVLNQKQISKARRDGYIETLPDRRVNPRRGYPLLCTRTESGGILTTVPLSYFVQGSAMWLTSTGMAKVDAQLKEWIKDGWDGYIVMQIHDEIILDVPKRANPKDNPRQSNLGRMRVIQRLLESGGEDFIPSIPTPFGCSFHPDNWAEEITF